MEVLGVDGLGMEGLGMEVLGLGGAFPRMGGGHWWVEEGGAAFVISVLVQLERGLLCYQGDG